MMVPATADSRSVDGSVAATGGAGVDGGRGARTIERDCC